MRSLPELLLTAVLPAEDGRHVLDELGEVAEARARKTGPVEAERWRRRQIWGFVLRALPVFWWKRPLRGFLGLLSNRDGRLGAVDRIRQDLRFALRSLRKRPTFTAAAVLILAVGIGATTTIYSVVDTVMLRPLPYPEPGELLHFGGYGGFQPRLFVEWRDGLQSFEGIGAAWHRNMNLTGSGPPERLNVAAVTPDLLPLLGATPHLGRLFLRSDFQDDPSVVLLGPGFWRRTWGGDPDIIGRTLNLDGRPLIVAGVLSPEFVPPEILTGTRVDLWLPFRAEAEESFQWSILSVVGRLRDEVGWVAAQGELTAFTERLAAEMPDLLVQQDGTIDYTRLVPLQVSTFQSVAGPLLFLMCAVLLMLLIACANVANLLLARGTARARELALRGALGASRGRVIRQLLTESITLALAGGLLGVGLAFLGVAAFLRFNPGGIPRIEELAVDPRILLFALLASVTTGLIFGTSPALHASRRDVATALQEGSAASSSARKGKKTRGTLITVEIALALVLFTSAGLFFRSLMAVAEVELGFQSENLVSVPLHLADGYDAAQRRDFTRRVKDRLEGLPGTQGVAVGLTAPFEYLGSARCCIARDVAALGGVRSGEPRPWTHTHPVTAGYFQTIGAEMAYGREFTDADDSGDGLVAVLNVPAARYFFGEEEATGQSLDLGSWGTFRIVGVVRGVRHWGGAAGTPPSVYVPWSQWGAFSDIFRLLVRSTTDIQTLPALIREAIWSVDPNLPVDEVVPLGNRVETSLAGRRFLTILLGTFATVALILATGGIYASMLYSVGQRKKEMGIRLAMGAGRGRVVGLVLRSALVQTLLGVAIGLAGSVGVSILLRSWLVGIAVLDRVTLGGGVLVLSSAALLASAVPALRAARTDPVETLYVE